MLGNGCCESNYIMLGCAFNFINARRVDLALFTNITGSIKWYQAVVSHRISRGAFNSHPRVVFTLVAPQPTHL